MTSALLGDVRALALPPDRDATVPGTEVEGEISELERPFTPPWFDAEPARGRQLVMSLDRADSLRHVLASLVRAARA